jgi:hypothetical protein
MVGMADLAERTVLDPPLLGQRVQYWVLIGTVTLTTPWVDHRLALSLTQLNLAFCVVVKSSSRLMINASAGAMRSWTTYEAAEDS